MRWRDHTEVPGSSAPAIIAHRRQADGQLFLMPQMYRYDFAEERWLGDSNCLPLKLAAFEWLPEADLLQTLSR